ncbi:MAG: glycoside hydrolase family 31 protein [Rikenellaceae bacterium]
MNKLLTPLFFLFLTSGLYAQKYTSQITSQESEKWWQAEQNSGGSVLDLEKTHKSNITTNLDSNYTSFLVSNKGRYIWSRQPFSYKINENGLIIIDSNLESLDALSVGKSLREAFLIATNNHFRPSATLPANNLITNPQYVISDEILHELSQDEVLHYANNIIKSGFPAGTLIIDYSWQKHFGNFEIRADRFSDPKLMIDKLHEQGFSVVLTVFPFVSPDSPEYRNLSAKGYLLKDGDTDKTMLIEWYNGYSSCLDLTNPKAVDYLNSKLTQLKADYGVDGFIFEDDKYRTTWEIGLKSSSQLLNAENFTWEGLAGVIPKAFESGFAGRNYFNAGLINTALENTSEQTELEREDQNIDQMLTVRAAQMQAMMPTMQFSIATWSGLDEKHLGYCRDAVKLREKIAPYILELSKEVAENGAPIIRHLDYEFPGKGFANCEDQFMLGNKYLVVPVTSKDNTKKVRLPNGKWIDDKGVEYNGPLVFSVNVEDGRLLYFEHLSNSKFKLPFKKK